MADQTNSQKRRIDTKIEGVKGEYAAGIRELLSEVNTTRLKGKGKIEPPVVEGSSLRWTLAWREEREISLELNIVANVEDDGRQARVGRVWVHRHASTPMDFEGHTPTTRMRRLTSLSIAAIREAIDAEWR
jgi:hypothetical protein